MDAGAAAEVSREEGDLGAGVGVRGEGTGEGEDVGVGEGVDAGED